jgi:protein-tyrosine phosphatase
MAAALLTDRFRRHGLEAVVASAGLRALVGRPAEPHAQALMRERGLDLSGHRARQLTSDEISPFELVLVMEARHERVVYALSPSARGRVHRVGRFGGFDVPDPYGRDRRAFERSLALIERGLDDFEEALWGGHV